MTAPQLGKFGQKLINLAHKLGKHNDPLNVVLTIALFKGINRPLFTMMDKKSNPEAKKYAAFREGLTEVIAATTYVATSKLMVKPLSNFLHKRSGGNLDKITKAVEFFSVCLSAAILIPAACNLVLNPVMKSVDKFNNKRKKSGLDIKETFGEKPATDVMPVRHTFRGPNSMLLELQSKYPRVSGGNMKVGV